MLQDCLESNLSRDSGLMGEISPQGEFRLFGKAEKFRFPHGPPNVTNTNYLVNRNWFGFVFHYNYSN